MLKVLPRYATALLVTVGLLSSGFSEVASAERQRAAEDTSIEVTLAERGLIGTREPMTARLTDSTDAGVAGATLQIWRRVDRQWTAIATVVTDESGGAVTDVELLPRANRFKATFAGVEGTYDAAQSSPRSVEVVRARGIVELRGKGHVVDGAPLTVTVGWHTQDGRPITGLVRLQELHGQGAWTRGVALRVRDGGATSQVRPRFDTSYRVVASGSAWYTRSVSNVKVVDNRPAGYVFQLPPTAPAPALTLRPQPRILGHRFNGVVRRVPTAMWLQMTGLTWHRGCPVGRDRLRLIQLNYWGFDGYVHRGELVMAASVAGPVRGIFADLYERGFPIRSIHREDRFGWSSRLHGANDYKSMRADNTSGFNCRGVVGSPSALSPHSYGTALDLNTWENPYRSARGLVPNAYWDHMRTPHEVVYRSRQHPVVRIFRQHGFRWLGASDWQHFHD